MRKGWRGWERKGEIEMRKGVRKGEREGRRKEEEKGVRLGEKERRRRKREEGRNVGKEREGGTKEIEQKRNWEMKERCFCSLLNLSSYVIKRLHSLCLVLRCNK